MENISGKEFLDQIKPILRRVPGVQGLNEIRHKITRIRELSGLIKEGRIVAFHPYLCLERDTVLIREIVNEVMRERIDYYGTARLGKKTADATGIPAGAIFLFSALAILRIPPTHEEYLKGVEKEIRRKIRVAERQGYEFKEFHWNDHLDEIYEINTSKEIRQSEPMRGWYRELVPPRHHSKEELLYKKYFGSFKDGKLYAYLHFNILGDLAISKHFIGHAQHFKFGIMNGLLSYTIQELIQKFQIQWLYYGDWQKKSSLTSFKREAGFQAHVLWLDLEDDQELLKYAEQKVETIWRL